jgi:hypothetical protein
MVGGRRRRRRRRRKRMTHGYGLHDGIVAGELNPGSIWSALPRYGVQQVNTVDGQKFAGRFLSGPKTLEDLERPMQQGDV